MHTARLFCLLLTASIFTAPLSAATVTFTDRSAWEAAVLGEVFIEDFNSIDTQNLPFTGTTTLGLITFETDNTVAPAVVSGTSGLNTDGSTYLQVTIDGSPVRTAAIVFPHEVTAWAMDYSHIADQTHVSFADVDAVPIGPHNTSGFIGYVSDTPFSRVELTDPHISFSQIGMDNISFNSPTIIPGDLNADGFVGLDDLDIVLGNWNQNVTQGDLLQGDPSNDGFVGLDDLDLVLNNWNAGTPPPVDVANIPEPVSAALMLMGAATLLRRR